MPPNIQLQIVRNVLHGLGQAIVFLGGIAISAIIGVLNGLASSPVCLVRPG
jgi:hypothetical protein